MRAILLLLLLLACPAQALAEDGYELWLRYHPLPNEWRAAYAPYAGSVVRSGDSPTQRVAAAELSKGLSALLGHEVAVTQRLAGRGAILIGTPLSSPLVRELRLPLQGLGRDGFVIRTFITAGRPFIVIAGNDDAGVLYGAFALLRRIQTHQPIERLNDIEKPTYALRMLNHWDNLDGFVERGYAGASIWNWWELPRIEPRFTDYARANASIGINGAVLTNVNANAKVLTPEYLRKVAALANVFRPYNIRVYLTARFSAPTEMGGLKTADPLDPQVRNWWTSKADEIYRLIPDFGGFLVKANSEGQPGPQDYHRTHADGANMLADAVAPHGGIVIWRAFVYGSSTEDRAKQAYDEFHPLDGKFRPNVVLQVKNGPIDFQPREPFSPLFGQMPHTKVLMEGQITKEYLGFSTHLAYLGTLWNEVLDADTCSPKCGTPVSSTLAGMAGVSNVGSDRNWTASDFDQANWYAFGRLAWNPHQSAQSIAEEWTRMTWGNDPGTVRPIVAMMMQSREAVVNYMTPLGLAHLMGTNHHYGPAPWVHDLDRPEWNPVYYHRANAEGIGFDRTATGSNAVAQYSPPVAAEFADVRRTPENYLLWFHHLPWDFRMHSGRTLWDELVRHYDHGVDQVRAMRRTWSTLKGKVDPERYIRVEAKLATQEREAQWWRDACIAYFQSLSKRPLPPGAAPPQHALSYYQALHFTNVPGTPH